MKPSRPNEPNSSVRRRIEALRGRSTDPDWHALLDEFERIEERHERSLANQVWLEERLARVENSPVFRVLRWVGSFGQAYAGKAGQLLLHSPLHSLYRKVRKPVPLNPYADFLEHERLDASVPEAWRTRPSFSVVMAVCDPPLEWLQEAIQSVRQQTYSCWQLCLCDDGSQNQAVRDYLAGQASSDRVCLTRNEQVAGISESLNRAAALATGDYLAFLDHDDRLAPRALDWITGALQAGPADILYSDEDWMNEHGERMKPNCKPSWSPDLLTSSMYMGHLLVVRREGFEQVGGFRRAYDGAQDYDLALRLTDEPAVVRHVSRILYHWRAHAGSTAASPQAKPAAHEAGKRALADALSRRGVRAEIGDGPEPHTYRVVRSIENEPLVSLVICSRNMTLFGRCLKAIERRTRYPWREVILVHHLAPGAAEPPRANIRVVPYTGQFNFAAMNNLAVEQARGEMVVFVNDDVEPLEDGWLDALIAQAQRKEIGVVGAKLLYPRGNLQHAGIATGIVDGAGHVGRGLYASDQWRWLDLVRDVSAVTGACLAMRRSLFVELGGFDEQFPVNYNDVDLCLRVQDAGYRVIYEPSARLLHREGQSRAVGTNLWERERFFDRWRVRLRQPDPYYSRFFDPTLEVPRIRYPLTNRR